LGDSIVPAECLAKLDDAWDRERRAGVTCCKAILGEVLLVHAEADDIVATCPAECERLRPDTRAEMHDVAAIAAEPGPTERLNTGHVDDHCQHSSKVGPNAAPQPRLEAGAT